MSNPGRANGDGCHVDAVGGNSTCALNCFERYLTGAREVLRVARPTRQWEPLPTRVEGLQLCVCMWKFQVHQTNLPRRLDPLLPKSLILQNQLLPLHLARELTASQPLATADFSPATRTHFTVPPAHLFASREFPIENTVVSIVLVAMIRLLAVSIIHRQFGGWARWHRGWHPWTVSLVHTDSVSASASFGGVARARHAEVR